jgi:intraflagellar transport protein 56
MNTYVKKGNNRKKQQVEKKNSKKKQSLKLEEFIAARDYTGAVVLLEFQRKGKDANANTLPWLGYAAFHNGEYAKALSVYEELCLKPDANKNNFLYKACCHFYLGEYNDAEKSAREGPAGSLQNRILFHCALKNGDDTKLMEYHQKVSDSTEDQLCLASIHYLRSHYQESTEIYKRLLIEHRDYLALQVYVALCYYKLDYYDVSLELLLPYLNAHKDSAIAINLKACNHYKLYDGKAAESELKGMMDVLSASSQNLDNAFSPFRNTTVRKGENALSKFWEDAERTSIIPFNSLSAAFPSYSL